MYFCSISCPFGFQFTQKLDPFDWIFWKSWGLQKIYSGDTYKFYYYRNLLKKAPIGRSFSCGVSLQKNSTFLDFRQKSPTRNATRWLLIFVANDESWRYWFWFLLRRNCRQLWCSLSTLSLVFYALEGLCYSRLCGSLGWFEFTPWWFGWLIELKWFWKRILMLLRLYISNAFLGDVMMSCQISCFYRSIIDRSYISGTRIRMILLMKEILHQLICRPYHYLQCFYLSQVVQDFFHQQYLTNIRRYILIELIVSVVRIFPIKKNTKEKWSIEKMRQLEKPHRERKYTACYWGETTWNTLTRWWFSIYIHPESLTWFTWKSAPGKRSYLITIIFRWTMLNFGAVCFCFYMHPCGMTPILRTFFFSRWVDQPIMARLMCFALEKQHHN